MTVRILVLACSVLWLLGCESGPSITSTPSLVTVMPSHTLSPSPFPSPTAVATSQPPPVPALSLAYSTADGVFLWNPQSGERVRIASEPAARLSWAPNGTWLATTPEPFNAIVLKVLSLDDAAKTHRLASNFTFPVWLANGGAVLALPCPGTSGRAGDFQTVDPVRGAARIISTAEVWPRLPSVAPDLSKALILPFNTPFVPSAVVVFDDWRRAPLLLEDVHFPSCPDAYAWSPDSRYLVYYSSGRFWVLDFDEPKPLGKLIDGPATLEPVNVVAPALAWSPDGKQLALALKGQLWIAELKTLTARRIEGLMGIFSGLSWAPASRRATPNPEGVLGRLLPYLNPADFYSAFVQATGRPQPRIIVASSDVIAHGPFVYLDFGARKLFVAPPTTRLNCPLFKPERPQAPALRLSSEPTSADGQETLVVTGGWYMARCKGTLIYRWDGSQLLLTVETSASVSDGN